MTFFNIATGQTLRECDFYALVSGTVYDCCNQSQNVWIAQPNNLAFNEYQWQQYFISNPPACGYTLTLRYSSPVKTPNLSLVLWNALLNGNYTSVNTVGSVVTLSGGNNINVLSGGLSSIDLISCIDTGSITSLGGSSCVGCVSCTDFVFPSVINVSQNCFESCTALTHIELPACTDLGGTTGDDLVFDSITGNTITAVFNSVLATCNAGDKDGDILYLGANNTCSITYV